MDSYIYYDAKADVRGGKNYQSINGVVFFKEMQNGVLLTAKINGLPKAEGKCTRQIFWISYS